MPEDEMIEATRGIESVVEGPMPKKQATEMVTLWKGTAQNEADED